MTQHKPLVSIIIPTYNRAHLIGETLDSIKAQTYKNWECIVVDDGSTDNTDTILAKYVEKDNRFQYHQRPVNRIKGANACRNYGFELSKGEYINWFDSDDIMCPEFIKLKMKILVSGNFNFVFSKTINFDNDGNVSKFCSNSNIGVEISAFNFIKQNLTFCTLDFMATKASIGKLRFNEKLKSGQEYNFISRYLFTTVNGGFIEEDLSKRRVHASSIQSGVTKTLQYDITSYHQRTIENKVLLLQDIKVIGDTQSKLYLVNSIISFSYQLALKKQIIPYFSEILKLIQTVKGIKSAGYFFAAMITLHHTGKGYKLYKKALR